MLSKNLRMEKKGSNFALAKRGAPLIEEVSALSRGH